LKSSTTSLVQGPPYDEELTSHGRNANKSLLSQAIQLLGFADYNPHNV
jgi:hypothetical protein